MKASIEAEATTNSAATGKGWGVRRGQGSHGSATRKLTQMKVGSPLQIRIGGGTSNDSAAAGKGGASASLMIKWVSNTEADTGDGWIAIATKHEERGKQRQRSRR